MQLNKIAVTDEMFRTDLLTVEYLGTPYARKLQTQGNVFVHQARDIEDRAATTHCEGLVIIRRFARRLRVDTDNLKRVKKKRPELIQAIACLSRHCQSGKTQSEQLLKDFDFLGIGIEITLVGY